MHDAHLVTSKAMSNLKIYGIVDDNSFIAPGSCQASAVVGELQAPNLPIVLIQFDQGLQWELAPIADMVREKRRCPRWIMIETLCYLALL